MTSPRTFVLLLLALLIFCFGLAANLQPHFQACESRRHQSNAFFSLAARRQQQNVCEQFFRQGRRVLSQRLLPDDFRQQRQAFQTPHMAEDTGAVNSKNHGDEDTSFMGPPRDWLDAFGRHFIPNRHTHLDEGGPADDLSGSDNVREILPWLKLSADLDPDNLADLHRHRLLAADADAQGPPRPRRFCTRACATIPTATKSCSNWAGSTTKATMTPSARGMSGNWPSANGSQLDPESQEGKQTHLRANHHASRPAGRRTRATCPRR